MKNLLKTVMASAVLASTIGLSGCQEDADVASYNLSKAADNFEIMRRVVFYNGITNDYILSVEGLCSVADSGHKVSFTCKIGNNQFVKHQLGLSDNVTYFSEQVQSHNVSTYHYRVTFKPQTILPDIDFRGDAEQLLDVVDDVVEPGV